MMRNNTFPVRLELHYKNGGSEILTLLCNSYDDIMTKLYSLFRSMPTQDLKDIIIADLSFYQGDSIYGLMPYTKLDRLIQGEIRQRSDR